MIMKPFGGQRAARKIHPDQPKKNLIMIQVESLELQALGAFNKDYPESMPYLSRLALNSTVYTNITQQPATGWSAAATFVTQCGYPHATVGADQPGVFWRRHTLDSWQNISCLGNFLEMMGYKREAWGVDSWSFMKIGSLLRGAELHDLLTDPEIKGDRGLYQIAIEKVLPRLIKTPPFFLMLFNMETHFPFFKCRDECPDLLPDYGAYYRCFSCFDRNLEFLIEGIRALGLEKTTEVVLFGDHLVMEKADWFGSSRKLALMFPFKEKRIIDKEVSYYDVLPTLLDLLDIEAAPLSPWGVRMGAEEVGTVPSEEHLAYLTNLFESIEFTQEQWDKRQQGLFQKLRR
jgi:phosphoglycerol transferase MdoB-like AlkP superfamily enzyme